MAVRQTISILGAGWLGTAFARHCHSLGMKVNVSTTTPSKLHTLSELGLNPFLVKIADLEAEEGIEDFFTAEIMVVTVPTTGFKGIGSEAVQNICRMASAGGVQRIVYISSTSVYPDVNREVSVEDANPDTDSGKFQYELENTLIGSWDKEWVILRLAGLFGPDRHPGRFLAGRENLPQGDSLVNLIHQEDCVGALAKAIQLGAPTGIFHLASPDHPTRRLFYTEAAISINLPIPTFLPESEAEFKIVEPFEFEAKFGFAIRHRNLLDSIGAQQ